MSTPPIPKGDSPASASDATPERKGVGCLAITLMAVVCIGVMLAFIALVGDPT
ncbi:MAG: hypothetical protein KF684_10095 [Phycisphaeraceae bacterium]|nr:hypothetical protein [Phycisphaeraceae bacterium]